MHIKPVTLANNQSINKYQAIFNASAIDIFTLKYKFCFRRNWYKKIIILMNFVIDLSIAYNYRFVAGRRRTALPI